VTQSTEQWVSDFKDYVRRMMHYQEALALMQWDLRTGAPKKGVELRSEAIGTLSGEVFKMRTSQQMEAFIDRLSQKDIYDSLDDITRVTLRDVKREYERNKKIPQERFQEYVVLASQAESVWEEAKDTNNFELFRPYLEKIVAMNIEFVGYWGYKDNKYDTLLDMYEPNVTTKQLDEIFGGLREETVKLVKGIVNTGRRVNSAPFQRQFAVDKQREVSRWLLKTIGYDFSAGRMDETVHPFMSAINHFDARVTTRFEADPRSALFSTIHEGGHALYEQGVSADLVGTPLCEGASMGIHESQSRFYENMIGRSREFWEANYSQLLEYFPSQLADVSMDDFYRAINDVQPSLIRIEADEVTYNLHIMIRYEIEKGLINETIKVADLPAVWREKMKDYLGIEPADDATGVLQDVHWAGGMFGYFPSYSLGNIYAAQFRHTLAKEMPDYMERVRQGDMMAIKGWLNDKIHQYGRLLTPREIVQKVTGEDINSKYLVDYLHEKYDALYGL
jgi:carboxypeptidase Taq